MYYNRYLDLLEEGVRFHGKGSMFLWLLLCTGGPFLGAVVIGALLIRGLDEEL